MTLSFRDLAHHRIANVFLTSRRWAERLIVKPECGPSRTVLAICDLRSEFAELEGDRYAVETLTVQVSVDDFPTEPTIGTAVRRETDAEDRWFSYAGPGEGITTDMPIYEFTREIPLLFGGNQIQ